MGLRYGILIPPALTITAGCSLNQSSTKVLSILVHFTVAFTLWVHQRRLLQLVQRHRQQLCQRRWMASAIVDLVVSGNITSSQMSNVTITTNQSANTTILSFNVTGANGSTGFGNITIPKSVVLYGSTPTIYIDNQTAHDQGYTQDANNYYVWYTTHFSPHQISIVFIKTSPSPSHKSPLSLLQVIYGVAAAAVTVTIVSVGLYLYLGKEEKQKMRQKTAK